MQPKTNCPGVAWNILWYDHCNPYAIETRIFLHGSTVSNMALAISLVLSMIPTTWIIISKISFICGFLIVVRVVFTEKSFEKWNEVSLEFRAIVEYNLARSRIYWKPYFTEYLRYSDQRFINDRDFYNFKPSCCWRLCIIFEVPSRLFYFRSVCIWLVRCMFQWGPHILYSMASSICNLYQGVTCTWNCDFKTSESLYRLWKVSVLGLL